MGNIFGSMEFEFKPLRPGFAKTGLWIGAETGLNRARKAKVEPVVGMKVREFATADRPSGVAAQAEARGGLLDIRQSCQGGAQLFDRAHVGPTPDYPLATVQRIELTGYPPRECSRACRTFALRNRSDIGLLGWHLRNFGCPGTIAFWAEIL